MKTISRKALSKAKAYLQANCGALPVALFTHFLERENTTEVLKSLSAYQNPDGGFGHGLEGDFLLPASSPMATSVGFQILTELNVPAEESIVQKGVEYLLQTYRPDRMGWTTVPREVNDYPHATWWHYDENEGGTLIDTHWGNPTAEIVGYLVRYHDLVPPDMLQTLHDHTLKYFKEYPTPMEMHELYCFQRFADQISNEDFSEIEAKLAQLVLHAVNTDPISWQSYAAQPLDFVKSPDSFLARSLMDSVMANLDFWIETRTPDGVWHPAWSWGGYEDAWQDAREYIIGKLTVGRLRILAQFNRVDP